MPDGKMIDLTFEQHNAPEVLFNTTHIGRDDGQNLQNLVANSLERCEVDNRKSLASNIILAGGTTMFRGFTQRLLSEIEALQEPGVTLHH